MILGETGLLYSLVAVLVGILREYRPQLVTWGLPIGLLGAGTALVFLGPFFSIPIIPDLYLSVGTFNLILIFSCLVQVNAATLAAYIMDETTSNEAATSVLMNACVVAYNVGAFIGPLIMGFLLEVLGFVETFAIGGPFLILIGLITTVRLFQRYRSEE